MAKSQKTRTWWQSIPTWLKGIAAVVVGITAVVTAVSALIAALTGFFGSHPEKPKPPAPPETRSSLPTQTEAKNAVNVAITCNLYSLGASFKDAFLDVIVGGRKFGMLEVSDRERTAQIVVTLEPGSYQYQLSGRATTGQEEKVSLTGKGTIDVQEGVDFFVEEKEYGWSIQRPPHVYSLKPGRRIPGQEKSFTAK